MLSIRYFSCLLLVFMFFAGCNKHSAVKGTVSKDSPAVITVPDNTTTAPVVIEPTPIPEPSAVTTLENTVAYIRKSACFGRCPVFEAQVKSDGTVEWNGRQYVDRLGKYRAKVSSAWIDTLVRNAQEQGYFNFAARYPADGSEIADIPHTICAIQQGGIRHTVDNGGDAPVKLIAFETFFMAQLEALRWEKM